LPGTTFRSIDQQSSAICEHSPALSGARLLACLIVAPQLGYDEPGIVSYAISSFYPTSADGLHKRPPTGGSHGKPHRTTKILSHARRRGGCVATRGARAAAGKAADHREMQKCLMQIEMMREEKSQKKQRQKQKRVRRLVTSIQSAQLAKRVAKLGMKATTSKQAIVG
jgi:hypothetical protein